jgi:RecA-family ATPase
MLYYVCALPNKKGVGVPQEFISNDPAKIEEWAKQHDKPGWGVYDCINPLKDGAGARNKENVAAVVSIRIDIEGKSVVETMDEIDAHLGNMLLPPTAVIDSGRGRHADWALKEPISTDDAEMIARADAVRARLIEILSGDRAPSHQAALFRRPGTHNSKDDAWIECRYVRNGGAAVDLTELEEAVALYDRPLLTPKPVSGENVSYVDFTAGTKTSVDVEARLAAMRYQGPGDTGINCTWWTCMGSLLRHGTNVSDTIDRLHAAAVANCQDDPNKENWHSGLAGMAERWLRHESEFVQLLDSKRHKVWTEAIAAGKQPRLVWRQDTGLQVRGYEQMAPQSVGAAAADGTGATVTPLPLPEAPFVLRAFEPFDLALVPPREFLFGRHYQRRTVSGTVAPGGTGKSSLVMVESIAMAAGRNLLDEEVKERVRVWYHNGEDNMLELQRRVGGICQHYNIPMEELKGWFFMTSGNEVPLRVAETWSQVRLQTDHRLVKCITEAIGDNKIDVSILDPLVTLHGVPENNPGQMDQVIRIFTRMADAQNCAIDLSHHTRKLAPGSGSDDVTIDDMRGAGAVKDAMRAVRMLNVMSSKDAENAGFMELERSNYFRIDRAKANYSGPAKTAIWRQFVNVNLPNGDAVGVIAPWLFPGQDGAPSPEKLEAERKAEHVFLEVLRRLFLAGRFVGEKGTYNAPHVIAKEREAKAAKVGKATLDAAMRRLFDKGKIRIEEYLMANRHPGTRIVEI